MNKRRMLLAACLVAATGWASAQVRVTGTVISAEDGQPVVGASVIVPGTKLGVVTDLNGNFTLNVPQGHKDLRVSSIGMESQVVAARENVKVALKNDTKALNELVVVAYGTASKQSITGAVSAIDAKSIQDRPVTNAAGVLEGAAPGIQINNSYGEPGSDEIKIRIRGFGSVNGTNEPLIVVNGAPYSGSWNDINPDDIESMSVLKDASSAALYGNKAANGVILITLKSGANRKLNVRASVKMGAYNRAIPEYDHLGINDWMETMLKGYQRSFEVDQNQDPTTAFASAKAGLGGIVYKSGNNIFDRDPKDWFDANGKFVAKVKPGYNDLDWVDAIQRTGLRQDYNVSADGGSDKYNMFASFGYLNEKGYISASDYNRFTGHLNANFTPTKWFVGGVDLSGTMSESNYSPSAEGSYYSNPFYSAGLMAPVYPYYKHNADGSVIMDENGQPSYDVDNSKDLDNRNIIYQRLHDVNHFNRNVLNGQVYGTVKFLNDFAATVKGNLYLSDDFNKSYDNPICGDGASNGGRIGHVTNRVRDYRFSQQLTWGHSYGLHHVDALLAHESFKHTLWYDYVAKEKQKISGDNIELSNFAQITSADGYQQDYTTESYLGRVRYNYAEKYYVDGSFRRDGSSRFYNPWGNFWSLGASWMISKEDFMKNVKWVNDLKLRASYGEVGNDAGVDYYAYKALYASDLNSGMGAYYISQNPNNDLKWETSKSLDIALEGRLFDRLNFSVDFFNKISDNLLFNVYNPLSAGATDWPWHADNTPGSGMATIYKNIGAVRNTGVEFAMDVDAVRTKDWKWNIGLNLTHIHNEITKLPDGKDILNSYLQYSEGHSMYEFYTYTYAGVDQLNGRALYVADPEVVTDDLRQQGEVITINGKDYVYNNTYGKKDWQGSAIPKVYGSISTALSWKNLSLSVLCTYSLGGKIMDLNYADIMTTAAASPQALHPDVLKAWQKVPEGMTEDSPNRIDSNGIPAFDLSSWDSFSQGISNRWLVSASYFALKNITLRYTLPTTLVHRLNLGGLTVFGTVDNLAMFTARKGLNPQYSFNGTQDNTFVSARVFTVGINLNF